MTDRYGPRCRASHFHANAQKEGCDTCVPAAVLHACVLQHIRARRPGLPQAFHFFHASGAHRITLGLLTCAARSDKVLGSLLGAMALRLTVDRL